MPSSWSALFILSAAAGLPSLSESISSWSLPAEAAGAFGNRAGSGVQGQLDNRPLQQEWGTVVSERQQCFRHSDWQCAGLMRSVWIMNEPADIPHNSLSSMKHNTKAQSLQGFTRANNWLRIQPHISNSNSQLPYCIAKFETFKLGFETTEDFLALCFHKENVHAFHAWAWRICKCSYIFQRTIIPETWCCNHLQFACKQCLKMSFVNRPQALRPWYAPKHRRAVKFIPPSTYAGMFTRVQLLCVGHKCYAAHKSATWLCKQRSPPGADIWVL